MASAKVNAPPVQMIIMMSVLTGPTDFIMEALDYLSYERVLQAAYVNDVNSFWFNALLIAIIAAVAVSIAIALVLARRISGQISKPLTEIGLFAGKVSSGQISMKNVTENSINVCSADEIGNLARILERSYMQIYEYEQSKFELQRLATDNIALERLNSLKHAFFQNMSHDFKTPLNVISTSVYDVMDMCDFELDKDSVREILGGAHNEVMRMARMVDNALDYSYLQDNRKDMKPMDIAPLLRNGAETYRALLERQGNILSLDIPQSLPKIFGNTDMLLQVLSNLITNANRYTRDGEIIIKARPHSRFVTVTVSDTGSGVKPELIARIFDRGVSDSGTGLGLSICKTVIEAYDGTIGIESEPGKGTIVNISIPIMNQEAEHNGK